MKNLILKLLVSGVAIAGVAVAVILIFFQKNPLEVSYNSLVEVMKVDGAQTKMEDFLNNDEVFKDLCGRNYQVLMKGEFDLIKNSYTKIPTIETEKKYDGVLEATNNYIEALEATNKLIEVYKEYKEKITKDYTDEKGVAPTETDLITYSTAYGNYQGQVMALVAEQINSASLLNDKLLACLQESYYGDVYNYDLAMDVLVNAYCKYTLANINETAVIDKLEKLVNANTPAVKEEVSRDTDGNEATEFVNSISKINVYSLISNADYKAGLDAEMQAHATIVEEYIARLCA